MGWHGLAWTGMGILVSAKKVIEAQGSPEPIGMKLCPLNSILRYSCNLNNDDDPIEYTNMGSISKYQAADDINGYTYINMGSNFEVLDRRRRRPL